MHVFDDLGEMMGAAFTRHADRPALEIAGDAYTYGDLWRRAEAFAEQRALAEQPGCAIGILPQKTLDVYVAVLAAVLVGRPFVSLNMKFPVSRQQIVVDESRCTTVVSDAATEHRVAELTLPAPIGAAVTGDSPAYFMFTSGTTGRPKGVMNSRNNVAAYLKAVDAILSFPPGTRCSQFFELSFDVSIHDIFYTWFSGGVLCPMAEEDGADFVDFIRTKRLDCWYCVPSAVSFADRRGSLVANALPDLKWALFIGEALPTTLAKKWLATCPNAKGFNLYGPTEATVSATGFAFDKAKLERIDSASVPIGWTNLGSETVIVTPETGEAASGDEGELLIGGPQVALGYAGNPTETAAKFIERTFPGCTSQRWYRTGDRVLRTGKDGYVFLGRLDDQIKIRGYRAEILEVEEALRAASGVSDVAAVPWPLAAPGNADGVVAFISGEFEAATVLRKLADVLPVYMVPTTVLRVQSIPLNQNGKVDRKALVSAHLEKPQNASAPATNGEAADQLVEAWASLFPGRSISVETSFASLNGDSLSYVSAMMAAEQIVGSVPEDWTQYTIQDLAKTKAPASRWGLIRIDTPSLLRAFGIITVLMGHLGYIKVNIGTTDLLIVVSGFVFGTVQMRNPERLTQSAMRSWITLLAIYVILFIPFVPFMRQDVSLMDVFAIEDFRYAENYLWYIHALIHTYMAITGISFLYDLVAKRSWPRYLKPALIIVVLFALGSVAAIARIVAVLTGHHHHQDPSDQTWVNWVIFTFFFIFAIGALLGYARNLIGKIASIGIATAKLIFGEVLTYGLAISRLTPFMPVFGAVMLAFVNNIKLPRPVAFVVYMVANASIYMYLLQPPLTTILAGAGVARHWIFIFAIMLSFACDSALEHLGSFYERIRGLMRGATWRDSLPGKEANTPAPLQ